jgi:hypothetical protein
VAPRRNAHGRLADAGEPELRGGRVRSAGLTYESPNGASSSPWLTQRRIPLSQLVEELVWHALTAQDPSTP